MDSMVQGAGPFEVTIWVTRDSPRYVCMYVAESLQYRVSGIVACQWPGI